MTERRQFIGYDSSAECDQFIGYDREIIIDNERKSIRVFGGDKVGGYETARADLENVTKATLDTKLEPTIETLVPPIIAREIADEVAELNGRIDSANANIATNELEIANLDTTKADKATSLNGYGIADAYTKSQVDVLISQSASSGLTGKASNYIEAIPNNIKLELASSVLTLKNGSKAYKFDGTTVNITKDLSISNTGSNGQKLVFTDGNGLAVFFISMCASSDTNPGAGYQIWYNNSEKKVYADSTAQGNFRLYNVAAPIGIVTCQGGKVVSIDQVFNGFGFIGSHWYYLEGTSGRDMSGRNADGSLNSVLHTASSLGVFKAGYGTGKYYAFTDFRGSHRNSGDPVTFWQDNKPTISAGNYGVWISQRDNFMRYTNDAGATWNPANWIYCGWYEVVDGKMDSNKEAKLATDLDKLVDNYYDSSKNPTIMWKVYLSHKKTTIDQNHVPEGMNKDDFVKTVKRVINITDPQTNQTKTITQEVTFTRSGVLDEVTKGLTYYDWSEDGKHTFDKIDVPTIPGYTPSQETINSLVVTPDTDSTTVNITYSKNSAVTVPINPSDNNSNNSNTAPTDNASKPTDETGEEANIRPLATKKANNSRSQKESKSKTKATGIKNSSTDNSKPNNGKSIADPMTGQKENGLTGVAQAATTGAKAGETNSNKLPQTGEKKGMLLSIIGLLAAALGIFGIAINRKKEN